MALFPAVAGRLLAFTPMKTTNMPQKPGDGGAMFPTSFAATDDDMQLLHELRAELLQQSQWAVSQSDVLRVALRCMKDTAPARRTEILTQIKRKRGRP